MRRVLVSPELADVGHGWLAVERERTYGDESVVCKHLARGRIVQRDPRAQPGESVLCGGELAHLAHRRCGQSLPRGLLRNPVPQLRRPICHFGQVHPPHHLAALGHQQVEVIRPGGLPREQLRMPRVELGEELVPPIRNRRREVSPILPLERQQGRCVVEAEQLKVWQRELEAWGRFRPVNSVWAGNPPTACLPRKEHAPTSGTSRLSRSSMRFSLCSMMN